MSFNVCFFLLQIKEGAEKLREVAKDRRALSDVASIVKKSNTKLAELKSELHELESQIILTQGNSNGKGELIASLRLSKECWECLKQLFGEFLYLILGWRVQQLRNVHIFVAVERRKMKIYENVRSNNRQTQHSLFTFKTRHTRVQLVSGLFSSPFLFRTIWCFTSIEQCSGFSIECLFVGFLAAENRLA